MEFMNRSGRPSQPASAPAPSSAGSNGGHHKKGFKGMATARLLTACLLIAATVLIVASLWFVVLGSPNSEARSVDSKKLQAVFLNGGQVYFGNIQDLNGSHIRMTNIYYLRVNQQVQPDAEDTSANDISLVKLGCELHGPEDEMLINRDQVIFWENLKDDGQVTEAVAEYVKQNPDGQDCATEQSQSTDTTTGTGDESQ